jgi:hypothetical protein
MSINDGHVVDGLVTTELHNDHITNARSLIIDDDLGLMRIRVNTAYLQPEQQDEIDNFLAHVKRLSQRAISALALKQYEISDKVADWEREAMSQSEV